MLNDDQDKRRTQIIKGKTVTFAFLDPQVPLPALEKITSVAVVPFTHNGQIVCALLDRGVDLPGGHMKAGEKTIFETAQREAMEEAFITLSRLEIAAVIQSDYYGAEESQLTYMVVLAGLVDKFEAEQPNDESRGRKIMPVGAFLQEYSAGDKNWMRDLVGRAQSVYNQKWKKTPPAPA